LRAPKLKPIAIAAGGTGGHFFPAEALAAELVARGHRIALLADARSGGLQNAVFAGHERFVIRGEGIAGRGVLRGGKAMVSLALGVAQARRILARLDAAALVGFGGYPSVAPVLATRLVPNAPAVILHEQNAVLGRANRFLMRRGLTLALSFADTARVPNDAQTVVTGNPVRGSIATLAGTPYVPPDGEVRLLVLGGSLGARVFSDLVPAALMTLAEPLRARISVVQQCRAEDLERVRDAYARSGIAAELSTFFSDVPERLAAAHLVIARAGASCVAELATAGRPSLLVPLPGAIDDHQTANAHALAATGGAWVLSQDTLRPAALGERLSDLLAHPDALGLAAAMLHDHARPEPGRADAAGGGAASRLADLVEALMRHEAHP
jgi:UDP-N-acetylglucosamine--N-acetylmuramyl-(pentapeptide) pyrophosphoryl-undecaprenol N-acetylglucosamine transferase